LIESLKIGLRKQKTAFLTALLTSPCRRRLNKLAVALPISSIIRIFTSFLLRAPLKIHFGEQANLFAASLRQVKAALSTDKADLPSLPASKNLLLAA